MSAFAIIDSAEPGVSRGTTPMAGREPGNDYARAALDAQAVRAAQASGSCAPRSMHRLRAPPRLPSTWPTPSYGLLLGA